MSTSSAVLPRANPYSQTQSASGLYAVIWRWHFYAGLFVAPFALVLAATGGIYLFKPQIEAWLYADLYNVPPALQRIDADAQVSAALAAFPGGVPEAYTPPFADTQSALVRLRTADYRDVTIAISPDRGAVLGVIDEQRRLMQVIRDFHGTLLAGKAGQALQELAASWAMILLVTGLYLWWPRHAGAIWGTVVPRFRARGRSFLRDLHAVTGFWTSTLLIFLVATGLPWTLVSGKVLNEIAGVVGKGMPDNGVGWGKGGSTTIKSGSSSQGWAITHAEHMAGAAYSDEADHPRPLSLDKVLKIARAITGIAPPFEIRLPVDPHGVYTIVTDGERDPQSMAYVHLDQYSGKVIADVRWKDFGPVAQAITLGISLHEGLYFGLANQLIGLVACLGLICMVTAGIVMWWRRRPVGRLGAPPSPAGYRIGPTLVVIAVAFGLIMPLMGLSLMAALIVDWILRRLHVRSERSAIAA